MRRSFWGQAPPHQNLHPHGRLFWQLEQPSRRLGYPFEQAWGLAFVRASTEQLHLRSHHLPKLGMLGVSFGVEVFLFGLLGPWQLREQPLPFERVSTEHLNHQSLLLERLASFGRASIVVEPVASWGPTFGRVERHLLHRKNLLKASQPLALLIAEHLPFTS